MSGTISLTACAFGAGLQNNGEIGRGVLIEERCPLYANGVVTREVIGDSKSPNVRLGPGIWYVGTARM